MNLSLGIEALCKLVWHAFERTKLRYKLSEKLCKQKQACIQMNASTQSQQKSGGFQSISSQLNTMQTEFDHCSFYFEAG